METNQVKTQVKAEKATSQFPTVIVERILEPRSDKPFRGVMLRWVTEKKGNTVLSQFLGGTFKENRVCVQTMADSVIDELGIKVGVNINEVFKKAGSQPVRISISEISEEAYNAIDDDIADKRGYSIKTNPETGEILMNNGQPIYRKLFVDSIEEGFDEYLATENTKQPVEDKEDDLPA